MDFDKAAIAELGGGIIRLPEIADEPGGRGHVDIGAGRLLLEMRRGGAADVERALEMHGDDGVELLFRHLVEEAVAQIACIVDHAVDAPERIERRLDDAMRALP